ncbi:MAG: 8-oxoguanine deaminase [Pseudomonadota bacterium]
MKQLWIKSPLAVFDPEPGPEDCGGGLVIQENRIIERVPAGQSPKIKNYDIFDASDLILLPGLINTHHHFYQTLTRAYRHALNKPLFSWLTNLYPLWANLTPEMVRVSTQLACAELLLSGCTTAGDHHYIYSATLSDALDVQAEACADIGIRAVLTRGSMSLGQDDGGLPPNHIVQTDDEILYDSERVISRWHDRDPLGMTQVALAPCSPFSVTPQLMKDTAHLADKENVLLHTHLAETQDENEFCLSQFGARPLDHIESCGWLDEKSWFAHGIHFETEEIRRLGEVSAGVTHCPSSNMLLASGICQVEALQEAGVRVGLGVDGSASNDHSNLIEEVRQAMLIQRLRIGLEDPSQDDHLFGHHQALNLATLGNAAVLYRDKLGKLLPGCAADLALFKVDEPRFSGVDDLLAGLVLGGAHNAHHVMVNGQWRVQEGVLLGTDLEQLMAEHGQLANQLIANLH